MPHFFVDEEIESKEYSLFGEDGRHIAKSLRMKEGENLTLCSPSGTVHNCVVHKVDGDFVEVSILSSEQTINPDALGHTEEERVNNLVQVMDGYFDQGAHHLNVNVFGKEKLIDAMEHPEKEEYANFTIRVSGYAVKFIDLTREQQLDVISRTCHATM